MARRSGEPGIAEGNLRTPHGNPSGLPWGESLCLRLSDRAMRENLSWQWSQENLTKDTTRRFWRILRAYGANTSKFHRILGVSGVH